MMKQILQACSIAFGALACLALCCSPALADKRVALVIGNSAYKSVPKLGNPANDAGLVGGMLRKAGFDTVDVKQDLNASEMRKALREFGGRTRDADVAVIYYAGHGMEVDGTNYLIPTDAALETDTDVYDEALPIDRVLVSIEPAKQLRLVILDACRDNPFAKSMKRTVASRAIGRGLAKVEPTTPNTMIAFAAKAGSTASDGDSRNSPFATALADHLPKPGLDLRKAFGFVRDDVLKSTANKQEPFVYGSLGGDDVPLVPAKPVASGPQPNPQSELRRDYELALQLGTRDGWEAFLAQYPEGFYANLAKGQLNKIGAEETRASAEQKARAAEQEKTRLIAERAQKAEQDKAAAAAKVAEDARIAAERQKQIEQARAEAAEHQRKVAEAAAAKALAEKQAAEKA
ncbi:caspase family protein, partial [Bradyrhizobium sp. SHOUNA76]|uniref:caspase family protein n=1 Tax=Bradyrhizobium sp. SHOUNA76 TaxID=2908927 RepID=UPI001FF14697